ncbi:MAG TPA: hypothetical protein ENN03_02280 [bacterium]|nr:hypothetical protein [bacterium]
MRDERTVKPVLSKQDRGRLDDLLAEAEKKTGTQIVLALVRRSDSYPELPWTAFALGSSLAGLAVLIQILFFTGWETRMTVLSAAGLILAAGAFLALLTVLSRGFARLFLPAHRAETEVRQYAESLFLNRELFATKGRRGVLMLVSVFEHKVILLPDSGLYSILTPEAMKRIIGSMTPLLKRRRIAPAFEAGLEGLARVLKGYQGPGKDNELPDTLIEEKGV